MTPRVWVNDPQGLGEIVLRRPGLKGGQGLLGLQDRVVGPVEVQGGADADGQKEGEDKDDEAGPAGLAPEGGEGRAHGSVLIGRGSRQQGARETGSPKRAHGTGLTGLAHWPVLTGLG